MDTEELVRRLVKMKWLFPKRDVGFLATQTPRVVDASSRRDWRRRFHCSERLNGGESVSEFAASRGVEALEALSRMVIVPWT